MKIHQKLRSYLSNKSTAWWVTIFISTLTVASIYRALYTRFISTEALVFVDVVIGLVFWLALQLISLPIVKRLFGDGMAYALAKAIVLVTNPLTVGAIFFVASLFRFTDFAAIMERLVYGMPPNTFDWLGLFEVIIPICLVFLAICSLRAAYLFRKNIPWRRLRWPIAAFFVGTVFLFSFQFIPTRADATLAHYLQPHNYSIIEKRPMWSCCMIRHETSEFSATDVYYKAREAGKTKYFHVSDVSDYRGFESGSQIWKASTIDQQEYEYSIKPW